MKKQLSDAIWIALAWVLGYVLVAISGDGLSAVFAYSLITGWWLAAFVSSKLKPEAGATISLMTAFYLVFLGCTLLGKDWFYKDTETASLQRIFVIGALQSLVFGSPILFNRAVDAVVATVGTYRKARRKARGQV